MPLGTTQILRIILYIFLYIMQLVVSHHLTPTANLWHNVITATGFEKESMKDVGVREFRDHASRYLSGTSCWWCAGTVGFYVPVKRKSDTEELRVALREAQEGLVELRRATGLWKRSWSRSWSRTQSEPGPHAGG